MDNFATPDSTAKHRAASTAWELLRVALLAQLAVSLGDPRLARLAARAAQPLAAELALTNFAEHQDTDHPEHDDEEQDDALPEVDDLLARRMPSRAEIEDTP